MNNILFKVTPADIKYTDKKLVQDFEAHSIEMNNILTGKLIEFTGVLDSIAAGKNEQTMFFNQNSGPVIVCQLLNREEKIQVGRRITVKCKYVGYMENKILKKFGEPSRIILNHAIIVNSNN